MQRCSVTLHALPVACLEADLDRVAVEIEIVVANAAAIQDSLAFPQCLLAAPGVIAGQCNGSEHDRSPERHTRLAGYRQARLEDFKGASAITGVQPCVRNDVVAEWYEPSRADLFH